MILDDQSLMPFGTYASTPMEKVPAAYLLYLWDECGLWEVQTEGNFHSTHQEKRVAVHEYIKKNFHALETECPDRIIQHRPTCS